MGTTTPGTDAFRVNMASPGKSLDWGPSNAKTLNSFGECVLFDLGWLMTQEDFQRKASLDGLQEGCDSVHNR
jgi:hypothetical protein